MSAASSAPDPAGDRPDQRDGGHQRPPAVIRALHEDQQRAADGAGAPAVRGPAAAARTSGRQRHDEKITVYVSSAELFELEQARLELRGRHGLAVDRGRIVREALAVVLGDLRAAGDGSVLVARLRER